ncbi:Metallophosphoesterase, partial [Pseudomonas coronafaciens pv. garcae]
WRSGPPAPIRPNLACLDYSAVLYGKLVAYRLDHETQIDPDKFVWVDVQRPEVSQ